MSRPLRIEFPGAVYHVTSRGDRRGLIYRDDEDRTTHLEVIDRAMDRFDGQVLAYCQMGNHFHLVLHTRQANLSRLMRHVNGVYTQAFNRRHGLVGHLFQGRFKAILVDKDAYLLALCRYVERNPVAAGMVVAADEWPWSSYRAHVCLATTPSWLDSDGLHAYLLGRPVAGDLDRKHAIQRYTALAPEVGVRSCFLHPTRIVFTHVQSTALIGSSGRPVAGLSSGALATADSSGVLTWLGLARNLGDGRRNRQLAVGAPQGTAQ